jgi:hypothetical protein
MGLVAGAFQALDRAIVNRWFMAVGDPTQSAAAPEIRPSNTGRESSNTTRNAV